MVDRLERAQAGRTSLGEEPYSMHDNTTHS
jgi:hypothetical protein